MAFPAKYEGYCSCCEGEIDLGDMIVRNDTDDGWCHEEC